MDYEKIKREAEEILKNTIINEILQGRKLEEIIKYLINNVKILSYLESVANIDVIDIVKCIEDVKMADIVKLKDLVFKYWIVSCEADRFLIIDFDESQSNSGRPIRIIYNITNESKPTKVYSEENLENEKIYITLKRVNAIQDENALSASASIADNVIKGIGGENGTNEEPTN